MKEMLIVRKAVTPKMVRPISHIERENLLDISSLDAQIFLNKCWDFGFWLSCDCNAEDQPVMAIRHNPSGKFSLLHLNHRTLHQADCPFIGDTPTLSSQDKSNQVRPVSKFITFHYTAKEDKKKEGKTEKDVNKEEEVAKKISKLGRFLYSLIVNSSLNQISTPEPINTQYHHLRNTVKKFRLGPVRADSLLWTHPQDENKAIYKIRLSVGWDEKQRRHGLFVFVVDDIQKKKLTINYSNGDSYILNIDNSIEESGSLQGRSAPYLVICTLAASIEDEDEYTFQKAFSLPVVSKSLLFPVESDYERRVVKKLISYQTWWQRKGLQVVIEKPLFDIEVAGGELCRPDFLIKSSRKTIILEVNGSHEEEYLLRKKAMAPVMSEIGELISFDACEAEVSGKFDERLDHAMKVVSAALFKN